MNSFQVVRSYAPAVITHDVPVDAEEAAAIEPGRVLQVARDSLEELPEQKNVEGGGEEARDPKWLEGVVPAELLHDEKLGDHRHLRRDHHGGEEEPETKRASRPLQPRESIGDERTTQERPDEVEDDEKQARPDITPEGDLVESQPVVARDLGQPRSQLGSPLQFERDLEFVRRSYSRER